MKSLSLYSSVIRITLFTVLQCLAISLITIFIVALASLTDQGSWSNNWNIPDLMLILLWPILVTLSPTFLGAIACELLGRMLSQSKTTKAFMGIGLISALATLVFIGMQFKTGGSIYLALLKSVYPGITILSLIIWAALSKGIFGRIGSTVT